MFCFSIIPPIPVIPILFCTKENGKADQNTKQKMKEIISELGKSGIFANDISSYGDTTFDNEHRAMLQRYSSQLFNPKFVELINTVDECETWIISDLLLLLKIARNRLINNIYLFDEHRFINANSMEKILNLGSPLTDLSQNAKLKSSFPLAIFTIKNFLKLY
ncbi:hypothetical protein TRFO_38695 [Tritrichomonas foetus]|uniref:Uncharacterized protein n=1 Tax=Tritrichomonas foetus TaxID=1144522 RepID=A0A1J4JBR7_9EUKA|nr:hypothetical protein TRFO_38695 [Tritrichomonas foetus]|eukprot:OHS95099.1 hypothetical protein TRFO_38695 [Tritrichomonas foetus]